MLGLIQDQPLLVSSLITHADRHHGATEIVSRAIEGGIHRYRIADAHQRMRRLAKALRRLSVGEGDRVATLAWNTHRHFEFYYAVSGIAAICHIINPRLFQDQIAYIVNHADDQYVFFDLSFAALVEKLKPLCPGVKGWIAMTDRDHMPATIEGALCYEDLLGWPRRFATPRARRAIPRARSMRIARRCCILMARRCRTRSISRRAT
jgi:3-(methylthio)propionyl---CoA ligase